MAHRLTIFTPTYNRAHTLPRLYESLCNQDNLEFEWFIVDDGSSDNTRDLVEGWMKEGTINITFYCQENSGKHVAHNYGVEHCKTDIFTCVDSDDQITTDFVTTVYNTWPKVDKEQNLAGIIALKGSSESLTVGTPMPENVVTSSITDLYTKHHFKGDTVLIFKTAYLQNFLFPVIKGEKFMTEGVVYDRLSREYEMLLVDKILYLCEYLEDGLSVNIDHIHKRNPKGYVLYLSQRIEFTRGFLEKIIACAWYFVGIWRIGYKPSMKEMRGKFYFLCAFPLAVLLLVRSNLKKKLPIFKVQI